MSNKKKNIINVDFSNAEASEHVTGSCYHISTDSLSILLDCGLAQSNNILRDYRANNEKFNFKVKEVDYLILSHQHADHSMRAPLLYKRGCQAKILVPKGTARILKDMYEDSARIAFKDAETLSRQLGKTIQPLYTQDDVNVLLGYMEEYDFDITHDIAPDLKLRFTDAGHIISSAQIELWVINNNQTKKILYTGDLGNNYLEKQYVRPFKPVTKANLVIGETTYGDKERGEATDIKRAKDINKIKEIVYNTCIENHARVLIPCFALDRMQHMITILYDLFGHDENFKIPVLIDSPLSLKHFKSYFNILEDEDLQKLHEVMSWKNIIQIQEWTETKHWAEECDTPCIILAASGMLQNGRVLNYLPNILSYWRNHILFCGFLSENSLGWKIKNGKDSKIIKINDKMCRNQCFVTALTSFSSHMQYSNLLNYYSNINCDKLVLVHGEMKSKLKFADDLRQKIADKSKTTKVLVSNSSLKIRL